MAIRMVAHTSKPSESTTPGSSASRSDVPLIGSQYDYRVAMGVHVPETSIKAALDTGDVGFVHSFVTGSAVDGPGMRVVAWLAGCQFRCVYCHNPDTWKMTNGMPVSVARAVEVVSRYQHDLRIMRGGLTISGGEPLMQHRFVLNVFNTVKKKGIHTALDTNGSLGDRLSDQDLQSIDLVLLDLKAMTGDLHKRLTGQDNAPIHAFARRLAALHRPIWVRFVLVPGWTDDMAEIDRIATFAAELGNVELVDVLPFHQMGRYKWERLKMDYQLQDAQPPAKAIVDEAVARFRELGLNAR